MDDLREDGIHDDFYSSLNITGDEVSRLFPRGGAQSSFAIALFCVIVYKLS